MCTCSTLKLQADWTRTVLCRINVIVVCQIVTFYYWTFQLRTTPTSIHNVAHGPSTLFFLLFGSRYAAILIAHPPTIIVATGFGFIGWRPLRPRSSMFQGVASEHNYFGFTLHAQIMIFSSLDDPPVVTWVIIILSCKYPLFVNSSLYLLWL